MRAVGVRPADGAMFLAIRERLAKSDPANAGWQRDLSVSYERIGDALVAKGACLRRFNLIATAWRSANASPDPTPAMPAGRATWQWYIRKSA